VEISRLSSTFEGSESLVKLLARPSAPTFGPCHIMGFISAKLICFIFLLRFCLPRSRISIFYLSGSSFLQSPSPALPPLIVLQNHLFLPSFSPVPSSRCSFVFRNILRSFLSLLLFVFPLTFVFSSETNERASAVCDDPPVPFFLPTRRESY